MTGELDEALVVRSRRGDRAAFEELVRRTARLLFAHLYLKTADVHKTEGYGGHPMKIWVHRRQTAQVAAWLDGAGFAVEAQLMLSSAAGSPPGILFARRRA